MLVGDRSMGCNLLRSALFGRNPVSHLKASSDGRRLPNKSELELSSILLPLKRFE